MSVAYGFEAPPRVVKDKSKYRIDAEKESRRIVVELLNDRSLRDLQPRQLEKLYVTRMSDKLKEENLNSQLISFKAKEKSSMAGSAKGPKKPSTGKESAALYDIKPLPHPNIKVDLQFFLTVRNDFQGEKNNAETLTDHFKPRPPSPPYIPKKTGVNVGTQIEDGDLFSFDLEVEPILRVIVTKTLEQARLEIEEQEEIANMKKYKKEYEKRIQEKSNEEEEIVNKELALIKAKDLFLDDLRKREKNRLAIQKKVQNMVIAKKYGSTLFGSAMRNLEMHGYYQPNFEMERDCELFDWLAHEAAKHFETIESDFRLLEGGFGEIGKELCGIRKPVLDKLGRKKVRKQLKKFNLSKKERKIRIFFENQGFGSTFFSQYLEKWLEGTLENFLEDLALKTQELEEKISEGNIPEEEADAARKDLEDQGKPHNVRLMMDTYEKVVFGLANNPLSSISREKRAISPAVLIFGKDGRLLSELSQEKRSLDYDIDTIKLVELTHRDSDYHFYDEYQAKINMNKLEESDVGTVLFCVELGDFNNLQGMANDLPYALARCYDPYTLQALDSHEIMAKLRIDELNGLIQATQEPAGGGGVNEAEAAIPNKVMVVCFALRRNLEIAQENKAAASGSKRMISTNRLNKTESRIESSPNEATDPKTEEILKTEKPKYSQWRYEGVKAVTFYKEGAREKTLHKIEELIRDEVRKARDLAEKKKEEARMREELEKRRQEEEKERKRQEQMAREKPARGRRGEPQPEQREESKEDHEKSIQSQILTDRKGIDRTMLDDNEMPSRCIGTLTVPLSMPLEHLKQTIEEKVMEQYPELWEATKYGWELRLAGKSMNRTSKIKRALAVTDLQWVCNPRPPTPPPPPEERGEEEDGSQEERSRQSDEE